MNKPDTTASSSGLAMEVVNVHDTTSSDNGTVTNAMPPGSRFPQMDNGTEGSRFPQMDNGTAGSRFPQLNNGTAGSRFPQLDNGTATHSMPPPGSRFPQLDNGTITPASRFPQLDNGTVTHSMPPPGSRFPQLDNGTVTSASRFPQMDNGTVPLPGSRFPQLDNGTAGSRFPQLDNGLMSMADYQLVTDVRSKLGLPLALLGCILNVLVVIVYARMPPSFVNRFLIGLQVLDTIFLLCTIYPNLVIVIHGEPATYFQAYLFYARYVNNYVYTAVQRANVFCTGLLSVDRCVVMLAPFNRWKRVIQHPVRIIIGIQIASIISSVYVVFKTNVVRIEMPIGGAAGGPGDAGGDGADGGADGGGDGGGSGGSGGAGPELYALVGSSAYASNKALFDNLALVNSFVFTYIPAIGAFVANVCMVAGLVIASRRSARSSTGDTPTTSASFFKMGNQKTVLVLVYSGLSLILLVPFMSLSILKYLMPGFAPMQKEHYFFISMGSIISMCDIVRSTMGFFVFLGLSRVFRQTFIDFILRRKRPQKNERVTFTTSS